MPLSTHGGQATFQDSSKKEYAYTLRLEKMVKEGVSTVALNSIFGSFLRQMQKHAANPL